MSSYTDSSSSNGNEYDDDTDDDYDDDDSSDSYSSSSSSSSSSSPAGVANYEIARRQMCPGGIINFPHYFQPDCPTQLFFLTARMDEVAPAPLLLRRHKAYLSGWGPEMIRRGGLRILDTSNIKMNQSK